MRPRSAAAAAALALTVLLSAAAPLTAIEQIAKLNASDAAAFQRFGWAIAVDGDTLAVGAHNDQVSNPQPGGVYIFERDPVSGVWSETLKIDPPDAAASETFGESVALDGDTLVVGAYGDNDLGTRAGAAYVFERDEGGTDNWGLVKKLAGSETAAFDQFGRSVALSGDWLLAGADNANAGSGEAYVFSRDENGADNWGEVARLIGGNGCGWSVAVDGEDAVVGAPRTNVPQSSSGRANVFRNDEALWGSAGVLNGLQGLGDLFGWSVDVDAGRAVVGARYGGVQNDENGRASVFDRDAGTGAWSRVYHYFASDGDQFDELGRSVAVSGTLVLAGAPSHDHGGEDAGAVYVLRPDAAGIWSAVAEIRSLDVAPGDNFGIAVDLQGTLAVVGAHRDDVGGFGSGSVYLYDLSELMPFADGFESGDTSAWSATAP